MAETTTTQSLRSEQETEVVQPRSRRRGIIIVVVAVIVVAALAFWWHSTFNEDTDDAQINGHLIQVSSRIAGQVSKVYVDENQVVKRAPRLPIWIRATTKWPWRTPRQLWPARRRTLRQRR